MRPSRTRAGDGARTHDIKLGKLALYQLSYARGQGGQYKRRKGGRQATESRRRGAGARAATASREPRANDRASDPASSHRRRPKKTRAPASADATVTDLRTASGLPAEKSQRSGLNRRPPDYESGALPLSYAGGVCYAQARTRTATPFGTTPSRWRVYQFHHLGIQSSSTTTTRAPRIALRPLTHLNRRTPPA